MSKTSKKVIFFGNERLATGVETNTPVLRMLVADGYDVVAVVSNYQAPKSRKSRDLEVAGIAEGHSIPLLLPNKLSEIKQQLSGYRAEVGILVAYGKIIPQDIIDIFPYGIINIHPSLLPLYRGPTPLEQVILDGSKKTGVSVMQLSKEMDAGAVYAQIEFNLSGNETKQQLADNLLNFGAQMLGENLPSILDGSLKPTPQDSSKATYCSLITKQNGLINWHQPAVRVEREIRAYSVWPKSRTTLGSTDVIITKARLVNGSGEPGKIETQKNSIKIYCGQDSLEVSRLKPLGRKEISASEFIRGYQI